MIYGLLENALDDLKDYVLGASKVPYIPYQEDGNWEKYLPKYENQTTRMGQETSGCTAWGTLNQIETLYKRLYNEEPNYSERFNYLLAGVKPNLGLDPQIMYETIRSRGVVDEKDLPMTDLLSDYLDTSDITGSLLAKGLNWLYKHDFMHEWVWKKGERPDNWREVLRDALTTSPIAVSVTAWREENGVYVSGNGGNNHWCMMYWMDSAGYMYVFDSYDHTKKVLHPEHYIRRAKRIWINKRTKPAMRKHIGILQAIVKRFMKPTLLEVCEGAIGTDASPSDNAPDELGCAETVTTLLRKVYPTTPIITGTYTLLQYLDNPKNGFVITHTPTPECIVLSPTGTGNAGTVGHVGIVLEDGIIASNDSRTGKFMKNYDLSTWRSRYHEKQGMPVFYYKHI